MTYSAELIKRFRERYESIYGLEITEAEANIELYRLARLLEILHLSVFNETEKEFDDETK